MGSFMSPVNVVWNAVIDNMNIIETVSRALDVITQQKSLQMGFPSLLTFPRMGHVNITVRMYRLNKGKGFSLYFP